MFDRLERKPGDRSVNSKPPSPKGRGVGSNPPARFEPRWVFPEPTDEDAIPRSVPTEVFEDRTRSILTRNDSPDIPYDTSINPYRGCEHGCSYCFARPTHAYLSLSPGLDFETKILAKPAAADLLRRELSKPRYRPRPIAIGTNTDPYQPVERNLRITRSILEVLRECRHPVAITTKSASVLRDLDLLAPMAEERLVQVGFSITTLDPALASRLEPRASTPARRLEAMKALSEAGVPVGVLVSPVVPGLTDHEIERILEAGAASGAKTASWILVRLPHELKEIFREWLERHEPGRAARVLGRLREAHGGKLYDPTFGNRMRGSGPYVAMLDRRFEVACRRLGLARRALDRNVGSFRPPGGDRPKGLFEARR